MPRKKRTAPAVDMPPAEEAPLLLPLVPEVIDGPTAQELTEHGRLPGRHLRLRDDAVRS